MAAKFPIIRTERTVPGRAPSVRAGLDVSTGAEAIGRAVSGFGGALANLGIKFDVMEGKAQADTAERNARLSFVQMLNEIRQPKLDAQGQPIEDNISRWDTLYNSHLERTKTLVPKNKRGARQYNTAINNLIPIWQERYDGLKAAKLEDNLIAASIVKVNALLDSATINNMALVATKIKTELEVRDRLSPSISKVDTEKAKIAVEHDIELSIAKKMALSDPLTTLESIKGNKIKGFDKLTSDDILRIRNMANSTITQAKIGIKQKDDAIGNEFLGLLINKLEPTKPQLTFDMIIGSDLSLDAKIEWESRLRVFDNYSETELEEAFTDKGEVLADIYDKIDKGTLTDELDTMVGKGLSPVTAQRIKREIREPYERDTEQLFKRIFGWSPELGFESKLSAFLYEKSVREWKAEVKKQDATGEKIIEIGRSVVRSHFLEHVEAVMPSDIDITRMLELALGEEIKEPAKSKPLPEQGAVIAPKTYAEFEAEVARLKNKDMEEAREYYDKWISNFTD